MITIKIYGFILNFILYILVISPIILISFKKKIYNNKLSLLFAFSYITIIEILLSLIVHKFSRNIFSFFSKTSGIVNFSIYISKILFIPSSLWAIKFLIPGFLYNYKKSILTHKKTTILFLSKIVVNSILIFSGYLMFSTKGALYAFPLCDFIYFFIYIVLFIKC